MADRQPIRTLVYGDNAFSYHRIADIGPLFTSFLRAAPGIDATVTADPGPLAAPADHGYDVVVDYSTDRGRTAAHHEGLCAFVRSGGGYVGIHGAAVVQDPADPDQAALEALLGGRFLGHPDLTDLEVTVADRAHPVTAGVEDFTVTDEPYEVRWDDDVAVRAWTRHDAIGRMPVVWTRTAGDGRVCYYANGHDARAFVTPAFQRIVTQAIAWAAGRA